MSAEERFNAMLAAMVGQEEMARLLRWRQAREEQERRELYAWAERQVCRKEKVEA